jgi:hypothetical protein
VTFGQGGPALCLRVLPARLVIHDPLAFVLCERCCVVALRGRFLVLRAVIVRQVARRVVRVFWSRRRCGCLAPGLRVLSVSSCRGPCV